ncbi:MAG: hypothetical protein HY903_11320 [Deltaproteobacteria bacterium]|nr:hypothetical protein [Deltaproteobacteria bacterium]
MKKLVLLSMVALVTSACGGSEKKPTDTANTCTAAQNGQAKCEGTVWKTCNGGTWATTKDCAATQQLCRDVVGLAGQVECYTVEVKKNEFETCTGSGAGNCATGMQCVSLTVPQANLDIAASICVTDCSANAGVCGARTCDDIFGWCVTATGAFGDPCGFDGTGCSGTLACDRPDPVVSAFYCAATCDGASVNTGVAGCPAAGTIPTECLAGAFVETQKNGTADVTCTTLGTDAACNATAKYTCRDVNTGGAAPERLCARMEGRCGAPVDAIQDLTTAGVDNWLGATINVDHLCGVPGQMCKPATGFTAEASCTELPYVGLSDSTASCATDADCEFTAGFTCMDLDGLTCATPLSSCVLLCDPLEAGGPDLTCPGGTTCKQIKVDCAAGDTNCQLTGNKYFFPFPEVQFNGSNPVTCPTGTGCDTTNGFACTTYGTSKYCLKAHKVCAL